MSKVLKWTPDMRDTFANDTDYVGTEMCSNGLPLHDNNKGEQVVAVDAARSGMANQVMGALDPGSAFKLAPTSSAPTPIGDPAPSKTENVEA